MKILLQLALVFCSVSPALAQDEDMLGSIDTSVSARQYVTNAFKSSRVINGHSMEFIGKGVLDFRILHRFGRVNNGIKEMFGLDEASMRMGFDYGISDNFTVGIGRSTFEKELDFFLKARPVRQTTGPGGSKVSIVVVAGATINTLESVTPGEKIPFSSRLAYFGQAIVGRKFTDRFSLHATPTLVHRNSVDAGDDKNTFALGVGSRYKFSKRMAFVVDYFYVMNGFPKDFFYNPLSVGIDIETGGHVFQLHFTNAVGMNERAFITETFDNWGDGDIRFGFNLSRVFTLGKRGKRHY
jgi:hypothetical protein